MASEQAFCHHRLRLRSPGGARFCPWSAQQPSVTVRWPDPHLGAAVTLSCWRVGAYRQQVASPRLPAAVETADARPVGPDNLQIGAADRRPAPTDHQGRTKNHRRDPPAPARRIQRRYRGQLRCQFRAILQHRTVAPFHRRLQGTCQGALLLQASRLRPDNMFFLPGTFLLPRITGHRSGQHVESRMAGQDQEHHICEAQFPWSSQRTPLLGVARAAAFFHLFRRGHTA